MIMLIRVNALSHCKITPRPLSCYSTPVVNLSDPILLYKPQHTLSHFELNEDAQKTVLNKCGKLRKNG